MSSSVWIGITRVNHTKIVLYGKKNIAMFGSVDRLKISSCSFAGKNHEQLKELMSMSAELKPIIDNIRNNIERPLTGNDLIQTLIHYKHQSEQGKLGAFEFVVTKLKSLGCIEGDMAVDLVANWALEQVTEVNDQFSTASGPRQEEYFKSLLAKMYITRPKNDVIWKIQRMFSSRYLGVTTAEQAVELYELAKSYPGTTTAACIEKEFGVKLNGLLSAESDTAIITGVDSGKPVLVKVLSGEGAVSEERAEKELKLQNPSTETLMPLRICKVDIPKEDAPELKLVGHVCAIMPHYPTDLAKVGRLLSKADLYNGGLAMVNALTFIHSCNLVHMDVKPSNIFLTTSGNWVLGDYGSMTPIGALVFSTTSMFLPEPVVKKKRARPGFDFYMLAASLVSLLTNDLHDILKNGQMLSDTQKIEMIIATIDHEPLQNLLNELLSKFE